MKNRTVLWLLGACVAGAAGAAAQERNQIHVVTRNGSDTRDEIHVFAPCDASVGCDQPRHIVSAAVPLASRPFRTRSVHVDRDGFVWLGAVAGVIKLRPPSATNGPEVLAYVDLSSRFDRLTDMAFDVDGNLVLAYVGPRGEGGMILLDGATAQERGVFPNTLVAPDLNGIVSVAVLPLTSGEVLMSFENGLVTRFQMVGARYISSLFCVVARGLGGDGDMFEDRSGSVWMTVGSSPQGFLEFDRQGRLLREVAAGERGRTIVARLGAVGEEVWSNLDDANSGGLLQYTWPAGVGNPARLSRRLGPADAALVMDGVGRAWGIDRDGAVYFTDKDRVVPTGPVLAWWQAPCSSVVNRGDGSGWVRAASIDRWRDEDGDGVVNLVEIEAGTNPFDPNSRLPVLDGVAFLSATASVAVGEVVRGSVTAAPGAQVFVFDGRRAPAIAIAGVHGWLVLEAASAAVLASGIVGGDRVGSAVFDFEVAVPRNPALRGLEVMLQAALMAPGVVGLSNGAPTQIR